MEIATAQIMTAMVTPFNENGQVDFAKTATLIEYLLANGTEGLIVGGTTGESPTLSHSEKLELYKKTVEIVHGRVPIIAGTGSFNTAETIAFTKEVAEIAGIDAALVVAPYYNRPNQEGLYQHFKAVAKASPLPIMIYNVSARTGVNVEVQTTLRLSLLENVIGIKECAGLEAMSAIIEGSEPDFLVYTGEDHLAFPTKCMGGAGVISVASHVVGNEMSEMYRLLDNGLLADAARIYRMLLPKMSIVFSVPSPAPVKAVLNQQGISVGCVRLPLVECTKEEEMTIFNRLEINR
ncbi:4-hydroxy-tetrahydrodipicolinate synthase [Carnobacterium maltaromaticum]|uniref:4-hydroxy-tetrahydrodipicolinate synthase n=1 Tax=Carnobacterium maltaromaticum TaxID=2751 RepID=UPI001D97E6C8|nr:4-hydroxy-tetrahydrodipicolinate synthase [Carnobacterium maltaromaticum]MCC4311921.1 dihydrodipicolinate synthase [Carnobacterium maltaromaticum]